MSFELTSYTPYDFTNLRHIGPSSAEMTAMLQQLNVTSLGELMDQTIAKELRTTQSLDWGPALSERDTLFRIRQLASQNKQLTSLIGQGYYGNHHACGDSTQYLRKSGLVYCLYPLSTRN